MRGPEKPHFYILSDNNTDENSPPINLLRRYISTTFKRYLPETMHARAMPYAFVSRNSLFCSVIAATVRPEEIIIVIRAKRENRPRNTESPEKKKELSNREYR